MNERKDLKPHTFGMSLLLVVFLILCLLTFAAISVAEARVDLTGSEKKFAKISSYNAAEDEAELTLDEYTAAAAADPDSAEREIACAVPIDEHNELQVEAVLLFDEAVNLYYYRITRWQVTVFDRPTDASQLEVLPDGRIGW